jgi:hypothetical protein
VCDDDDRGSPAEKNLVLLRTSYDERGRAGTKHFLKNWFFCISKKQQQSNWFWRFAIVQINQTRSIRCKIPVKQGL